eukprot:9488426-Pyramimonas_sp.AAC.1
MLASTRLVNSLLRQDISCQHTPNMRYQLSKPGSRCDASCRHPLTMRHIASTQSVTCLGLHRTSAEALLFTEGLGESFENSALST